MKKLLLIDTSEITREMLTATLEKDFKVVAAENDLQGLDVLDREAGFDIVVITLWRTGIRGLEVLQTIRADSRFKNLAVVIIEPKEIKDEVTALTLGADDVIILPSEPEFILLKIKNVMMNRELLVSSNNRNGLQNNILDESYTAIYVVDAINYTLYYVNHAARKLMGCTEKNYTGKRCYSYLMQEKSPCPFCKLAIAHTEQSTAEVHVPRIGKTLMHAGDFVSPSKGALARIVQMDPVRVTFPITDRAYLAWGGARVGDTRRLRLRLADGAIYPANGKWAFSDNEMSAETATLLVRAHFPNANRLLVPNAYVTVLADEADPKPVPVVPALAVAKSGSATGVWLYNEDGTVSFREIEPGLRADRRAGRPQAGRGDEGDGRPRVGVQLRVTP